jgi:hypothetical protein
MDKIKLLIDAAGRFYNTLRKDPNDRFRSWEHCYKRFYDVRISQNGNVDYDNLSLHLAFYLASWGMYRGSSFLLKKDYRIHIPVVKILLQQQYKCLYDIECIELKKTEVQNKLRELEMSIKNEYAVIRKSVKKTDVQKDVSNTLITKILMGTLGCVPAYDRYFVDGVKALKVTTGTYSKESLIGLVDFYKENQDRFEEARKNFWIGDLQYPQMKVLDMGFWQYGLEHSGD